MFLCPWRRRRGLCFRKEIVPQVTLCIVIVQRISYVRLEHTSVLKENHISRFEDSRLSASRREEDSVLKKRSFLKFFRRKENRVLHSIETDVFSKRTYKIHCTTKPTRKAQWTTSYSEQCSALCSENNIVSQFSMDIVVLYGTLYV